MRKPGFRIEGDVALELCYGENRRQGDAELYIEEESRDDPLALQNFKLLEGSAPSFINMTDIHRVLETATRLGAAWETNFGRVPYLALAVKHGNCCGVGVGIEPKNVLEKMVSGDPEALSGGVVLTNFSIGEGGAGVLRHHIMPEDSKRILDSVIAPFFTPDAIELLARKKTGKCRLFTNPGLLSTGLGKDSLDATPRFRQVRGGFLTQDGDPFVLHIPQGWKRWLTPFQAEDLVLGWAIGSTSNSNSIVLTSGGKLLGAGVNQRSRVMACKVALLYAETYGHSTRGAVAYSDSFFPFPDAPMVLADAGVSVIFATTGSIRDDEVREACRERGVTLLQLPDAEARGFYGH